MAQISDVNLEYFREGGTTPNVRVSYTVSATHLDGEQERSYQELVELIGVDEGPHEDGQNEVVATLSNGVVQFDTSHVAFQRIVQPSPPVGEAVIDEDSGIFRTDELRARVTLTPLPPAPVSRDSNLVMRFQPVLES